MLVIFAVARAQTPQNIYAQNYVAITIIKSSSRSRGECARDIYVIMFSGFAQREKENPIAYIEYTHTHRWNARLAMATTYHLCVVCVDEGERTRKHPQHHRIIAGHLKACKRGAHI